MKEKERFWLYVRRVICVVLLMAAIVVIYKGLDFVMTDDSDIRSRQSINDFYEQDNVDVLFLGSSHGVYGLNAGAISEETGLDVFNLATTSQDCSTSSFILEAALEAQPNIKQVYCEISYQLMKRDKPKDIYAYLGLDYIRDPILRARLILTNFSTDKYVNSFLRLRRNANALEDLSLDRMIQTYKNKTSESYKDYSSNKYMGRGFFRKDSTVYIGGDTLAINSESENLDTLSSEEFTDYQYGCIEKMIDLCNKKGVKLVFYIAPKLEYYFSLTTGWDDVSEAMGSFLDERGITLLDLNLVKDEYLNPTMEDFSDADHLNYQGSLKKAAFFSQYIQDPDGDYFCDSMEEKYPADESSLFFTYQVDKSKGDVEVSISTEPLTLVGKDIHVECCTVSGKKKTHKWKDKDPVELQAQEDGSYSLTIPKDDFGTYYRLSVIDDSTGETITNTVTSFRMK